MNKLKNNQILPGLLLSFAVAAISKGLATFFPEIGGATIAILLGILLGNTFFRQPVLATGTKFSESKLLEYSVVLLGFTVTFQTISEIGVTGVLFVVLQMSVTIVCAYGIGRKLGFGEKLGLLMAGGNAVCGSSAIGAIAPAIGAKDEEKGQIITLVNLLGTVMMLTLPFLGIALFGDNLLSKSALLGGTLQSVGQVVAGASLIDAATVQYAMLFKIMRIMMLVVVVFLFEQKVKRSAETTVETSGKNKKLPIPWYVLGFLIACVLNSFVSLPEIFDTSAHFISTWFETTALAAIGLRLDFKKFLKEGPRFLMYGVSVGAVQTVAAVVLIFLLHIK
ncbi:YeiH family putative sulfate export transporter [Enterococcus sp. 669A]|uniref:YeiH family putative sulfate export transporter n=1 Tax=Candidatus Enterococcus moelleringii TaxID=2815325 RepID=A0ABS3L8M8_9ENTE|nr:YeiH family protein [Enterococcus sp. 669A]MBO1305978.1 YeiH family putative sulfate export transporter [Enterococcus sp. 669A]